MEGSLNSNQDWKKLASKFNSEIEEAILELQSIISQFDPIEILSRVAAYVLVSLPDQHKDAGGPAKSETNLEYLVSFIGAHPIPNEKVFPPADTIQRVVELITHIHLSTSKFYSVVRRHEVEGSSPIDELVESFRGQKLHVRGDGYWDHLRVTMADLLSPHAAKLDETLGFSFSDYSDFMDRTEQEIQNRLLAEVKNLGEAYRSLMKRWFSKDGKIINEEGFRKFVSAQRHEIDQAKQEYDRIGSPDVFMFRPISAAEEAIVELFSTGVGTNAAFLGKKSEHAFKPLTPSATDSRPILSLGGKHYAFNISKLQREAYILIGDRLREKDQQYWEHRFLDDRDDYLERETARLLKIALPEADVLRRVTYPIQARGSTEADIVVIVDGILMIVECKAGRLNPASWRGGGKKLIRDMEATIVAGLGQAERFVGELTQRGAMEIKVKGGDLRTISAAQFTRVFSINVTLDLISAAASTLRELTEAGMLVDTTRCWSVSLNDLRVIVDILTSPAVFIHYIVRRLDTNSIPQIEAGDELDLLMHYVVHGLYFRGENAPEANQTIMLTRYTDSLDQYYRRLQGVAIGGAKPKIRLGSLTFKFLDQLRRQRPKDWLTASIEILEFDLPIRENLFGKIQTHLAVMIRENPPFTLSFVANFESRRGIAIALSREPRNVKELVILRCQEHCREHEIGNMMVLHFGVPVSSTKCVVHQVSNSLATDAESNLLKQLQFVTLERRQTSE